MKHAFTVDLEDWYHGIPVSSDRKRSAERRLNIGTDQLLELLGASNTRATFFCLAAVAHEDPDLLHRIAQAGHDIGYHGLSHDFIYEMSPKRFEEETHSSVCDLEDCVGKRVQSYRAAYFSITRRCYWALEILAREGIRYDSSIFPVRNWRYGISDYPRKPALVQTESGPIWEFPISTRRVLGRNIPATGGAYFRIYPYRLTSANVRSAEQEGLPVVFYLHPWELDATHPVVTFHPKAMATHYFNLKSTAPKLKRLLKEFAFTTLGDVLDHEFPPLGSELV